MQKISNLVPHGTRLRIHTQAVRRVRQVAQGRTRPRPAGQQRRRSRLAAKGKRRPRAEPAKRGLKVRNL